MRYQPERALTHDIVILSGLPLLARRNEISAREGIDTADTISFITKLYIVEMRYQPERALTPDLPRLKVLCNCAVEMRYQSERALTQNEVFLAVHLTFM